MNEQTDFLLIGIDFIYFKFIEGVIYPKFFDTNKKIMKGSILILTLGLSISIGFSQVDTIRINGHDFLFKLISINDTDGLEKNALHLYRVDKKGNEKFLLSHTLDYAVGDCNSMSVEMGDFKILDSTLTFYTFWCRQGDAPVSPWGARIQKYKVTENGIVKKASSRLYIESSKEGWHENEGIKYLYKGAKNEKEQEALMKYIKDTEEEYNAKFVFGKESDQLLIEVKKHF